MTLPNQDVGTNTSSPVLRGSTINLRFTVTPLTDAEVASAIYRMLSHDPQTPGANVLITKQTGGQGVTFANNPTSGVDFDVVIDPADTASLFEDDYYHGLWVTKSNGLITAVSTGTIRLTAGAPALV